MDQLKKERPEKTAQELTGLMLELIAENAREQAAMHDVRFIATRRLGSIRGEVNWHAAIVSAANDEQRRIVEWAASIVQFDWNMLERRSKPRHPAI